MEHLIRESEPELQILPYSDAGLPPSEWPERSADELTLEIMEHDADSTDLLAFRAKHPQAAYDHDVRRFEAEMDRPSQHRRRLEDAPPYVPGAAHASPGQTTGKRVSSEILAQIEEQLRNPWKPETPNQIAACGALDPRRDLRSGGY